MRVLIIIAMLAATALSFKVAHRFFILKNYPATVLFFVIALFSGFLVVGSFFGWIGA